MNKERNKAECEMQKERKRHLTPTLSPDEAEREWLRADRLRHGRDCISQMRLARRHPEVLASALREMGVTENGDDLPDEL
jgi:hypothetical protein